METPMISLDSILEIIDNGIAMEQLNLESAKTLNDFDLKMKIRHKIADARIFKLMLQGNLPSNFSQLK
jgi:hypothetical protein